MFNIIKGDILMSELVDNCPRCGTKSITFDLIAQNLIQLEYNWKHWIEAFCICRSCHESTVFVLSQKELRDEKFIMQGLEKYTSSVNRIVEVEDYISIKDKEARQPPEYLSASIDATFREGAICLSVDCFNAAGTMFRLCIDLATKSLLPEEDRDGLNAGVRRSLGLRLPWLFDNNILPETLRDLSSCIKDDGNDGAHEGTLGADDAEDIFDFTYILLERIYTEPKRIKLANERRKTRRS